MAVSRKSKKSSRKSGRKTSKQRYIGKPTGIIQDRVRKVGPQHFGVISVDCAKRRSTWMLCDFYGRVIVEPTNVEHTKGGLRSMIDLVEQACQTEGITDRIAAVEMTGVYHKPVQRALRKAGFDTRTVHPNCSEHHRSTLHSDNKTDPNDLEAIFHAAINGYGLALLPIDPIYSTLQRLCRQRRNLVKQRARIQVQVRSLMHQSMPGYADLWDNDKFFESHVAVAVAKGFPSADAINKAQQTKIAQYLRENKTGFKAPTLDKIVAWSAQAAEPDPLQSLLTEQWMQLNKLREVLCDLINDIEQKIAHFLVKTPYILLLSLKGINIVSAGELAGEAGPMEHYASATAINGRAGLYPARYQSDEVDRSGNCVKSCNRRLRAACLTIAKNLAKHHPHYRGLASVWAARKVNSKDIYCRTANRANRMIFQVVSGRQVWRGKQIDPEYLLDKIRNFHSERSTPLEQTVADMNAAFEWLPKSTYAGEAESLAKLSKKKRKGAASIGELLIPLLIRLGVRLETELKSESSEA